MANRAYSNFQKTLEKKQVSIFARVTFAPKIIAALVKATGGALGAATYYYNVSAIDAAGNESFGSAEVNTGALTGSTNMVTVVWHPVPGAVSYRVWRNTSTGAKTTYATVPASAGCIYVDVGQTLATGGTQTTVANGVPTLDVPASLGVTGVSRIGTGQYRFQFGSKTNNRLESDTFVKLAGVYANWNTSAVQGVAPGIGHVAVTDSKVAGVGIPAVQPIAAADNASTGGVLAAATYYYRVSAINANGEEGIPSGPVSVTTTGSTSAVTVRWGAVPGAIRYKVYRATTATGHATAGTIYHASGTSYTDTGSTGTAASAATYPSTTGTVDLLLLDADTPAATDPASGDTLEVTFVFKDSTAQ